MGAEQGKPEALLPGLFADFLEAVVAGVLPAALPFP